MDVSVESQLSAAQKTEIENNIQIDGSIVYVRRLANPTIDTVKYSGYLVYNYVLENQSKVLIFDSTNLPKVSYIIAKNMMGIIRDMPVTLEFVILVNSDKSFLGAAMRFLVKAYFSDIRAQLHTCQTKDEAFALAREYIQGTNTPKT